MATTPGRKTFVVLENNPAALNPLIQKLGLSAELQFHDVYSLDEPALLSHIPRPAHALLAIIPMTGAWAALRATEDAAMPAVYPGRGGAPHEPVLWFKQTIGHACGSIGALHCCLNGGAAARIAPGSALEAIRDAATPLGMAERASMLHDDEAFEVAHASVASNGDTLPPDADGADRLGQHFVAFVKGPNGHLWELEGSRRGPIDRGALPEDEDVLSPRAVELGIGRYIRLQRESGDGDLRFSCTALA
ncbi:MAG: hypothetical protein M1818_003548 [Claussenomyces sp. TS43310]|nr:MAG: hypothetical protein M1818_003548 [Claussenomyces sp. TS43310]